MKYIISDKITRQILEAGNVSIERDKEWISQGDLTTTYGYILKRLEDNADLQVLYLSPGLSLYDINLKKVNESNTGIEES